MKVHRPTLSRVMLSSPTYWLLPLCHVYWNMLPHAQQCVRSAEGTLLHLHRCWQRQQMRCQQATW